MNKRNAIILFLVLSVIFFNGCKNGGGAKEGELVYRITYVQSEDENPLIALLPKTITIKFKNDNTVAYIEGFFGTFNLKIITNQDKKKNYTVLRILDKKFINEAPIDSLSAAYENIDVLKVIERPSDTATFAGIVSYQVDVVCNKMSDSIISIYCTKDFDIDNPNSNSPFYQVNGVLTKFQARVAGIDMIFELEDFNNIEIDDKEFLPPDDYKKISGQELKDILKSFQE